MAQLGLWTKGLFNLTTTITVISPAVSINKQQTIKKDLYNLFGDIKCIILNKSTPIECKWMILIEDAIDQAKLCSLFAIKGEEETEKIVYFPSTTFGRKQIEANGTGTPMVFNFDTEVTWIGKSTFVNPLGAIWKNNVFRLIWRMDSSDLVRYMPVNMTGMNENLSTWTNTLLGLNFNLIIRKADNIKPEREALLKKDLVKFFIDHGYTAHIIQLDDMEFQIILNDILNPQDLKKWMINMNQLKDLNIANAFSNPLLFIGAGSTDKDIRWTYLIRYAEGHFIFGRSIIEDDESIYEDLSLWTKTLFCGNRVWVKISPSGRLHRVAVLDSVRTFLRKFGDIIHTQEIPQGWIIWMDRDVSLDDLFMRLPESPIKMDTNDDRNIPDCLLDFSILTLDNRITEIIGANWNINYGITG